MKISVLYVYMYIQIYICYMLHILVWLTFYVSTKLYSTAALCTFVACLRTMLHEIEFYYATSLHLFYNPLVCSAHFLHMNDHHYIRQIRDNDGNHVNSVLAVTMPISSLDKALQYFFCLL